MACFETHFSYRWNVGDGRVGHVAFTLSRDGGNDDHFHHREVRLNILNGEDTFHGTSMHSNCTLPTTSVMPCVRMTSMVVPFPDYSAINRDLWDLMGAIIFSIDRQSHPYLRRVNSDCFRMFHVQQWVDGNGGSDSALVGNGYDPPQREAQMKSELSEQQKTYIHDQLFRSVETMGT